MSGQFARGGGDTLELRGDTPADLVKALDALAMANDQTRHAYCVTVLDLHVRAELHRLSVLNRALRGNPLLSETDRSAS